MTNTLRVPILVAVLCCALPVPATSQSVAAPDRSRDAGPVVEYQTYAIRHKLGFARKDTRVGDYAVTTEKGFRKGSGKSDGDGGTSRTRLSFTTTTAEGMVARTKVGSKTAFLAEEEDCPSGVLSLFLCSGDLDYREVNSILRATITLDTEPTETWQLEVETLPVTDEFGSRKVWGYGSLSNGVRTLELFYRGASPWTLEECLQMRQAGDERKWDCYRKAVEIEEDGQLLAWHATHDNTYTFLVGLDSREKLVALGAMEAFLKSQDDMR